MKHFKLPDLGEGLQEAEIVEWHIKAGDSVHADQLVVSVETAKALVDIPAPQDGVVAKLFGREGDILHVGEPLLAYEGEDSDAGTVVGRLEGGGDARADVFFVGAAPSTREHLAPRATRRCASWRNGWASSWPACRAAVRTAWSPGPMSRPPRRAPATASVASACAVRSMAINMARSHAEVVPVTIYGDADLHRWALARDPLIRLGKAIAAACEAEPILNSWFDGRVLSIRRHDKLDLGIAVDTPTACSSRCCGMSAGAAPKTSGPAWRGCARTSRRAPSHRRK